MPQTGRLFQERPGRHAAVPRRDPDQRQERKEPVLFQLDAAFGQFPRQHLQAQNPAAIDHGF